MTYEEALKIIEAEYETLPDSPHNKIIRTGLTYNGFNSFCVSIYTDGESVILTDLGETKEVFDEVTEGEWRELCEAHGFEFRHWRIVKVFGSIDDVDDFIRFLDLISTRYFDEKDED